MDVLGYYERLIWVNLRVELITPNCVEKTIDKVEEEEVLVTKVTRK